MTVKRRAASAPETPLSCLKSELERHDDALFEHLSAHLVSRLLGDVAVTVAKSGYQAGTDAGTAGLRGRRLRIECKRYKQTTPLNERALAGEVLQAANADDCLEAWILVATKAVRLNERSLAMDTGETLGIPVIILDWTPPPSGAGLCALAALCATWPEVVEQHIGGKAAVAARALAPLVGPAVDHLRKDLEVWNMGYRNLREASHQHLRSIWGNRTESRAYLNQDAAGGAPDIHCIPRVEPLRALASWWDTPIDARSVAVITGLEGVGKTWTALDWVQQSGDALPIVLIVTSASFATDLGVSVSAIEELLANTLQQNTRSTLSDGYWRTRVRRLLARPPSEGATLILLLDGLNQHPRVNWLGLLQAAQAQVLAGRIRLLVTCRAVYFEQDLGHMAQLEPRPVRIPVHVYSDTEFEEVLKRHGMTKDDLAPDLQMLARTPRLFPLVYRLKGNEALKLDATAHRLLYEYGRGFTGWLALEVPTNVRPDIFSQN